MVNSEYQDIKVQLYYVGSAFMDINSLHMLTCNIHEHRKCNCEKKMPQLAPTPFLLAKGF